MHNIVNEGIMSESIQHIRNMVGFLEQFEVLLSSIKRTEHANPDFRKNEDFKKGSYELGKCLDHLKEFLHQIDKKSQLDEVIESL